METCWSPCGLASSALVDAGFYDRHIMVLVYSWASCAKRRSVSMLRPG